MWDNTSRRTLTKEDFEKLVAGELVSLTGVEIKLADIGFAAIIGAVTKAMRNTAPQRIGKPKGG